MKVSLTLSPLNRPDASCTATLGPTTCTASMFGPAEPLARSATDVDALRLDVALRSPGATTSLPADFEASAAIRKTLEPCVVRGSFPGMSVALTVRVADDGGGALPCALLACVGALVAGAVPMTCVPVAVECSVRRGGEVRVVGMDAERGGSKRDDKGEEEARVVVGFQGDDPDPCLLLMTKGSIPPKRLVECVGVASVACKELRRRVMDEVGKAMESNRDLMAKFVGDGASQ